MAQRAVQGLRSVTPTGIGGTLHSLTVNAWIFSDQFRRFFKAIAALHAGINTEP